MHNERRYSVRYINMIYYKDFKKTASISVCILAFFVIYFTLNIYKQLPKESLNITQLATLCGYHIEEHEVITEDGYLLALYNIPHDISSNGTNKSRIPVLLIHGYLLSAVEYVIGGAEKSLGLLLVDEGFDVWLLNVRGTTLSRRHKTLNPDVDEDFWNFSYHEIGYYDIPSTIDHILNLTGHTKLHYVGYSQGTLAYGVMLSQKPDYSGRIKLASLLAPIFYAKESTSRAMYISIFVRSFLEKIYDLLGNQELFSSSGLISSYLKSICHENSSFLGICLHINFMIHGRNEEQLQISKLGNMFMHFPSGSSFKQLLHNLQTLDTGLFQQFDYGPEKNRAIYGSDNPPIYDLKTTPHTPTALYYAENDAMVHPKSVAEVEKVLPNVVQSYKVPLKKFTHLDFIHAKGGAQLLYNFMIEEIVKHNNE